MATWEEFTPGDLFPTEMAAILPTIQSTADTLGTVLGIAADIVDLVSNFVNGLIDPNEALILATQALINSVTEALLQTGVFVLPHIPDSAGLRVTPTRWISQVAASFDDSFDEERPIITDPTTFIGALAVMGTGSNYRVLMSGFKVMFDLFGAVTATLLQLQNLVLPGETPPAYVSGTGRDPNWKSFTVAKIVPAIGSISETFQVFSSAITSANSASDIYSGFADGLRNKSNALGAAASTIADALATLTNALNFSGAFILPIYGQGDSTFIQDQLTNSTGGPLDLQGTQLAAGFLFLSSGGTTIPRDVLFDLFGVIKENT